ncbi:MAG: glycosyltransferase involved in cell wall biosynthesis [Algoriphagus sp.]|jgi:glycosyltransferase involved in cell wall biosynthesis
MSKVLLSTKSYPPVIGGSASLLYEILRHLPEDYFTVIHGVNDPPGKESDLHLPFPRKQIKFLNDLNTPRATRYLPKLYQSMIEKSLQKAILKVKIRKIYAHFPNALFLVAAYKVAKKNKLPLVVYFDILWDATSTGAELELSNRYEEEILKYAEQVFAITEFACAYLENKHNRKVELIPHTVDVGLIEKNIKPFNTEKAKIHFAGGIYDKMNSDSVFRMVEAVEALDREIEIEFCSPDLPSVLSEKGYTNTYVDKATLLNLQRESSILYLPQAFHSVKPVMIRNNFPTKVMEYVCSGVPILLHSPADSYLTYIAKKEGFAYIVDKDDPKLLQEAVTKLLHDQELRNTIVQNAFKFAHSRNSEVWAKKLKLVLD